MITGHVKLNGTVSALTEIRGTKYSLYAHVLLRALKAKVKNGCGKGLDPFIHSGHVEDVSKHDNL